MKMNPFQSFIRVLRCFILILFVFPLAGANATTTYSYLGSPFNDFCLGNFCDSIYTTSNRITASITFGAPLPAYIPPILIDPLTVLDFSITDGFNTVTHLDELRLGTFNGAIVHWEVFGVSTCDNVVGAHCTLLETVNLLPSTAGSLQDEAQFLTCLRIDHGACIFDTDFGANFNDPGVWFVTSTPPQLVPEPSSLLLLGAGLVGVAYVRCAQKKT